MKNIIKIAIQTTSGLWFEESEYIDYLLITRDTVQYRYKPKNRKNKRGVIDRLIQMNRAEFKDRFERIGQEVARLLDEIKQPFPIFDTSEIFLAVTYEYGSRKSKCFCIVGEEFSKLFGELDGLAEECNLERIGMFETS